MLAVDKFKSWVGVRSGFLGPLLAVVIVGESHSTIWPLYLLIHEAWSRSDEPLSYFWPLSVVYFGVCILLVGFCFLEFRRYPGMLVDALCGGCSVSVAAALRDPIVKAAISNAGMNGASWILLVSTGLFLIARASQGIHKKRESIESE